MKHIYDLRTKLLHLKCKNDRIRLLGLQILYVSDFLVNKKVLMHVLGLPDQQ